MNDFYSNMPKGRGGPEGRHDRKGLFPLLLLTFALCCFSFSAIGQADTPCECAQRWTEGAAWNGDGTVDDSPAQNYQPKGVIKCGSAAETQSNIQVVNNCVYNPLAFEVNVQNGGGGCIDPSTGQITYPQNPATGTPMIWFNFDVRQYAGTFQVQFNDNNAADNIA